MYTPRHFQESREAALAALIRAYPLATVVLSGANGLSANHVPLELAGEGALHGHVARANELVAADGAQVLVIFQGADGYISPNWYPSKQLTHREVPTWNYSVVHVHGRLRVIDDRDWLLALLHRLTNRHEASEPAPWSVSDAPADHVEKLLKAIVGIEIVIDRIEGKFKLSQNHPAANQAGAVDGLRRRAQGQDLDLAIQMSKTRDDADGA